MPKKKASTIGLHGEEVLKRLYYGPDEASSFSSANRLFEAAKKEIPDLSFKSVREWPSKQVAYTRHKKPKLTFSRRKVLSLRIDETWAADLIRQTLWSISTHNISIFSPSSICSVVNYGVES